MSDRAAKERAWTCTKNHELSSNVHFQSGCLYMIAGGIRKPLVIAIEFMQFVEHRSLSGCSEDIMASLIASADKERHALLMG